MKPILKFQDFVNEGKQSYSDFKDEVLNSIKKLDAKKHGQIVDAMVKGKKNDRYTDYIFNSWENRWPALKTSKGLLHMDESNQSEDVNESNSAVSLAKTIAKGKYILVSGRKDDSSADYSPIEIKRGTREFNEIADIIMSVAIDESTETNNDAALSESTSGKDIVKVIADYIEYKFQYGSYTNSTPREDLIKFSEGLVAELKKKNIKKIS